MKLGFLSLTLTTTTTTTTTSVTVTMSATQVIEQHPSSISLSRNSSRARPHTTTKDNDLDLKDSALSTRVPSLRATSTSSRHHLPDDLSRSATAAKNSPAGTSPQDGTIQPFDGISEPGASGPTGGTMSLAMKRKEQAYFIAMCCPLFLAGWNELRIFLGSESKRPWQRQS